MGITRCPVECPGCKVGIVLRLGIGHDKRQGFFYVCPRCQAATKGALIWNGGTHTRLELADGRQLPSEEGCTEALSINLEIPSFPGAKHMSDPGGSPFLTFSQWLGADTILQYQRAFYLMRQGIDTDWTWLSRLSTYYLNHDAHHFDNALRSRFPKGESLPAADWQRDDAIHHYHGVFFGPMWALQPQTYFLHMKKSWNALWSFDRHNFKQLVSFAQNEIGTSAFMNTQRTCLNKWDVTWI